MPTDPLYEPLYETSGSFMLRAPVLAADTLPSLAGAPPTDPAMLRKTVRALTRSPRVRQALHVASPSLTASAASLTGDETGKSADRTYSALLRYLTRMSTRPTPHGLFAGVAAGSFTKRTAVGLAADPVRATRTRADGAWLHTVVRLVEQDPAVRDVLPVRTNSLLHRVGTRAVIARGDLRTASDEHVDIAVTRPVEAALELACNVPTYAELVGQLVDRFPTAGETRIRGLLGTLWDLGVLISALRPPLSEPHPEEYVADVLSGRVEPLDAVAAHLREFGRRAGAVDARRGRAGLADLDALITHQRGMTPGFDGATYQQDTALAVTELELPTEIASAVAEAADLLMLLGNVHPRLPHIVDYHREFLERYGVDSEIPLLDVVNAETGLGPPNRYLSPARPHPLPSYGAEPSSRRDDALIRSMAHALRYGLDEIEIDDTLLDDLTAWRPGEHGVLPRTSLDLYFQIAAASQENIRRGRWRLVLGALGCHGGLQTFGRFFDLFDGRTNDALRDHLRAEEALRPETIFAELNYHLPTKSRTTNVAIRPPGSRGYEICVNAPPSLPPERQIPLTDVRLGADGERFYLRSARLGRRLYVSETSAVNSLHAPNVCRALMELSADGYTPRALFELGVAADAPFVPRLVRGRIVLHPAQWTVSAETFAGATDVDAFEDACGRWRAEWNVPRYVYLSQYDKRLLLDLDHPAWVEELRREIRRADPHERVRLQEMLPGASDLWLRDAAGRPYHSEFVAPVLLRKDASVREPARSITSVLPDEGMDVMRRCLPGEDWTYLKLYSALNQHDAVIAGPLRTLVRDLRSSGLVDRWFYLRYCDPQPHLRLRFRAAASGQAGDLMSRCTSWGRRLVAAGHANDLVLASYDREIERYGGPHCIDVVEQAFSANSDACAELVALLHERPELDADVAGVAMLHALYTDWGISSASLRLPRVGGEVPDSVRKRFREIRPVLCEVLAPDELRPDARAARQRELLAPVLRRQHGTLGAVGSHVRRAGARGLLTGDEEDILGSLAHIQSIRLFGLDRGREIRCRSLWSLALRAIDGRRHATRQRAVS